MKIASTLELLVLSALVAPLSLGCGGDVAGAPDDDAPAAAGKADGTGEERRDEEGVCRTRAVVDLQVVPGERNVSAYAHVSSSHPGCDVTPRRGGRVTNTTRNEEAESGAWTIDGHTARVTLGTPASWSWSDRIDAELSYSAKVKDAELCRKCVLDARDVTTTSTRPTAAAPRGGYGSDGTALGKTCTTTPVIDSVKALASPAVHVEMRYQSSNPQCRVVATRRASLTYTATSETVSLTHATPSVWRAQDVNASGDYFAADTFPAPAKLVQGQRVDLQAEFTAEVADTSCLSCVALPATASASGRL